MISLDDKSLGKLLSVITHYSLENLEDIIPYNSKSEKDKDEIVKAALKSLEVSCIITMKFFNNETFNNDLLSNIHKALESKKFAEANNLINKLK
jgi:hypothetical protein